MKAKNKTTEITDGQRIRKDAVNSGLTPITDTEVAAMVLDNLGKIK